MCVLLSVCVLCDECNVCASVSVCVCKEREGMKVTLHKTFLDTKCPVQGEANPGPFSLEEQPPHC